MVFGSDLATRRVLAFALTSLVVLTSCLGSSLADETLCPVVSGVAGSEQYPFDDSLTLAVNGFAASIKYVSNTDISGPLLTIQAASEEYIAEVVDGTLTISAASCAATSSSSPTDSPTSSALMTAGLMMPFFSRGGMGSSLLAMSLLSWGMTSVLADGNQTCTPAIDIEISVPSDCPYNNFIDGVCMTPTQIADMTVQALFVDFDVDAAMTLLADGYIQHNPTVPTGAAPVLGIIPVLQESGLAIEVHRTLEEGNLVAYHSTYSNATIFGGETLVGFDVFRVEGGQVQEHWDNLQDLAGPNPNGNTMVDGPTMIKYLGETQANKELAIGLVTTVLVEGNVSAATDFISTVEYTQHNPGIADGLDGLAAALAALAEQGLSFDYDSIELVVAEGNFVLLGSIGEFGAGNPTAYYDLFRVEDGLIVEHWDVIQSVPPAEEFVHDNGKF